MRCRSANFPRWIRHESSLCSLAFLQPRWTSLPFPIFLFLKIYFLPSNPFDFHLFRSRWFFEIGVSFWSGPHCRTIASSPFPRPNPSSFSSSTSPPLLSSIPFLSHPRPLPSFSLSLFLTSSSYPKKKICWRERGKSWEPKPKWKTKYTSLMNFMYQLQSQSTSSFQRVFQRPFSGRAEDNTAGVRKKRRRGMRMW